MPVQKVVEPARFLAGLLAERNFSDCGTETIKVESPADDDTRDREPPVDAGKDSTPLDAAYFHICNRAIAADFGREPGRRIVGALIAGADVAIKNFKVAARPVPNPNAPSIES